MTGLTLLLLRATLVSGWLGLSGHHRTLVATVLTALRPDRFKSAWIREALMSGLRWKTRPNRWLNPGLPVLDTTQPLGLTLWSADVVGVTRRAATRWPGNCWSAHQCRPAVHSADTVKRKLWLGPSLAMLLY